MATTKKSEASNEAPENNEETAREGVYNLSRKILMAAVGAAVIAQDEIDGFVTHLAERGDLAEKEAHGLMKEVIEHRNRVIKEKRAEFKHHFPKPATKADIDALTVRIAELTKQIEELKKA
jgi:polyhydroxyalkanoate synthesis regulator phasin